MFKKRSEINLHTKKRINWRLLLGILFFIIILALGTVAYGFVRAIIEGPDIPSEQTEEESPKLVRGIKRLVFSGNRLLDGYEDDRVNILVLGVGGAGHDGPQLSDTIILASYRPSDQKVSMLSLPRDLAVEIPGHGVQKINHANAYGEADNPGNGGDLASEVVSEVLGEPIHYWVRIDFSAFEKVVDILGGLSIHVDQSFVDEQYPDNNFGYQTIVFEQGVELMDGERALQFARSRHGSHGEGSDFARARRQQKILTALRKKIITPATLSNPAKLTQLFNTLTSHVDTNLNLIEIVEFAKKGKDVATDEIVTHVLSVGSDQFLQELSNDYGYFLVPKAGDYSDIQHFVDNMFDEIPAPPPRPIVADVSAFRDARIVVLNGTWEPGLAAIVKKKLSEVDVSVKRIGNTRVRDVEVSTVYQLKVNEKVDAALSRFVPILPMNIEQQAPPFTLEDEADIVVVIGLDYQKYLYGPNGSN